MISGLSENQPIPEGTQGAGANPAGAGLNQMRQERRMFQSPQNSFLGGTGPNGPQYDESLAQSNMNILNSAGGLGGPDGLESLHPTAGVPASGFSGIQSTMNRKEKRFFQKKDL